RCVLSVAVPFIRMCVIGNSQQQAMFDSWPLKRELTFCSAEIRSVRGCGASEPLPPEKPQSLPGQPTDSGCRESVLASNASWDGSGKLPGGVTASSPLPLALYFSIESKYEVLNTTFSTTTMKSSDIWMNDNSDHSRAGLSPLAASTTLLIRSIMICVTMVMTKLSSGRMKIGMLAFARTVVRSETGSDFQNRTLRSRQCRRAERLRRVVVSG